MKNNKWVIGVALIAVGIFFSFTQGTRGEMQSSGIGQYRLEPVDGTSNIAWKIDTVTGQMWRCQVALQQRSLPPGVVELTGNSDMETLCLQIP